MTMKKEENVLKKQHEENLERIEKYSTKPVEKDN